MKPSKKNVCLWSSQFMQQGREEILLVVVVYQMYSSIKVLQSTSWAIYLKYDGRFTNATDYKQLYSATYNIQFWFLLKLKLYVNVVTIQIYITYLYMYLALLFMFYIRDKYVLKNVAYLIIRKHWLAIPDSQKTKLCIQNWFL